MRRRGFTLLELLIAMVIGVILLVVSGQVFITSMRTRDRLRVVTQDGSAMRRAYETMSRDMHSTIVPPDDSGLQFGLTASDANLGANILQFAAVTGDPLLASRTSNETCLIQYAIAPDPQTGVSTLWRYETPYPVPEGTTGSSSTQGQDARAMPLLAGVAGASYLFYSPTQATWVESWDGETGLPTAMRVDLALGTGSPTGSETETARQETWTFAIPAARFANEEADAAAQAEANGTGTGTGATAPAAGGTR